MLHLAGGQGLNQEDQAADATFLLHGDVDKSALVAD